MLVVLLSLYLLSILEGVHLVLKSQNSQFKQLILLFGLLNLLLEEILL